MPTITENTATLLSEAQRQDDDDRDPFADLDDDEEELETNELLYSRGLVDNTGNSGLFFNHVIVVLHNFTTCSTDRNKRRPRIVFADSEKNSNRSVYSMKCGIYYLSEHE